MAEISTFPCGADQRKLSARASRKGLVAHPTKGSNMIYMTRTGSIAPGKAPAAHAFAQKVATYWKTEWDRTLDIRRPIGGNPNRIAWVGQYKDLADYEAATVKSSADPK